MYSEFCRDGKKRTLAMHVVKISYMRGGQIDGSAGGAGTRNASKSRHFTLKDTRHHKTSVAVSLTDNDVTSRD